jgi:hypothetical protein
LIFPVTFAVIVAVQIYWRVTAPTYAVSPDRLYGEGVLEQSQAADDAPDTQRSKIESEFRKLCNVLILNAEKQNSEPPDTLAAALSVVQNNWPDKAETFHSSFPCLQNSELPHCDPWGRGCTYQVDRRKRKITLRSFGENGRNDETAEGDLQDDDIVVVQRYGRPEVGTDDDSMSLRPTRQAPQTYGVPLAAAIAILGIGACCFGRLYFRSSH